MANTERVPSGREPRIVVVDDEPSLLACIAMILREENYQVFEAHSATEAFEHLRAFGADLLLADVKMPVNNGFTLIKWVRAEPAIKHIPIILFTSSGEERRARRANVFDYIAKPVGREELLERVFRGICMGVMNPG